MEPEVFSSLLGLDIGWVNTRASIMEAIDGKYRLLGCESANTTLGQGLNLGSGAGDAMRQLQKQTGHLLLEKSGKLIMPDNPAERGVDRIALTSSIGPLPHTILLGLSEMGSIRSGKMLVDSLPLSLKAAFSMEVLVDAPSIIKKLVRTQPEIIILTGGEDEGAEHPLIHWIETLRIFYTLIPASIKPMLLYAGNHALEEQIRRRLEPLAKLKIAANLQPRVGEVDLVPAKAILENEILNLIKKKLPGMAALSAYSKDLEGTKAFGIDRMVRFLSQDIIASSGFSTYSDILALDIGSENTLISAGKNGQSGTVIKSFWRQKVIDQDEEMFEYIRRWTGLLVPMQKINQYLCHYALNPWIVPENTWEMTILHAFTRFRLKNIIRKLSMNYSWVHFQDQKGLRTNFEPIIASGSVLTHAPNPSQTMLMLLDGLQPWGITSVMMDQHHLLPLLGIIASVAPILAIHILESDVFETLGTVVTAVSDVPLGKVVLTVRVTTDSGKDYSLDVIQGELRHLVIPKGVSAVLDFKPTQRTDLGFGTYGVGGQLRVVGSILGVVIDARGRPIRLPSVEDERVEQLQRWQWMLGS
ncbi:MAG: glutamate mutase L [Anaerolineales bacterium]